MAGREVWRIAPATLVVVVVFLVVVGLGLPTAAYLLRSAGEPWPIPAVLLVLAVLGVGYGWRFGLHPRIVAGTDLAVRNPFRTERFGWDELDLLRPGQDGLVVVAGDRRTEAWCVQTSRRAQRLAEQTGRPTRADRVVDALLRHVDADAPEADGPATLRRARPDESALLTEIERDASLAAHGAIFPPEQHPYPTESVRDRWRETLADPAVRTMVAELDGRAVGLVSYEHDRIRHLAVRPEVGRRGIGSELLDWACEEIFDRAGVTEARLWVLAENHGARALYTARGWTVGDQRRTAEFPPYPDEVELVRTNPRANARHRR